MKRVLTLFGTRPEVIKLAPVIAELERRSDRFETRNIASSQHVELLHPFARHFGIRIDPELMTQLHQPNCRRKLINFGALVPRVQFLVLARFLPIWARQRRSAPLRACSRNMTNTCAGFCAIPL